MRARLLQDKYIDQNYMSNHTHVNHPKMNSLYNKYTKGRSLDNIHHACPVQPKQHSHHVKISHHAENRPVSKPKHASKINNLLLEQRKTEEYLLRIKKESDKIAHKRMNALNVGGAVPVKGLRSTSVIPFNHLINPLKEIDPNIIEKSQINPYAYMPYSHEPTAHSHLPPQPPRIRNYQPPKQQLQQQHQQHYAEINFADPINYTRNSFGIINNLNVPSIQYASTNTNSMLNQQM